MNDYNPLLMLWKANIDIQFVAEASLVLAHYVSGYVPKAERSNMQEIWQEVSDNKSIYSCLWSFGIRSLRFRECGLYEASDLLLGDHLTEKSDTVKWVDVSMPHKRSRRLKNHKVLQELAKNNPHSQNIFQDNVLDIFYPQRPASLEKVCLYDFVANYEFQGIDTAGQRVYRKLGKPSNVKSINEARKANMEEKEAKEDNEPQLLGEARTAMSEVLDMKADTPGHLTLDESRHAKQRSEKSL